MTNPGFATSNNWGDCSENLRYSRLKLLITLARSQYYQVLLILGALNNKINLYSNKKRIFKLAH